MTSLYREFATQAQIDAQYNPSLKLPYPTAPGRNYAAQSAVARTQLQGILDVPYGPTLAETLDIFCADVPNAPVFVFIHGGYWRAGSKTTACRKTPSRRHCWSAAFTTLRRCATATCRR